MNKAVEKASGRPSTLPGRLLTRERVRNYSAIFAFGSLLALTGSIALRLADPGRYGVPLPDYLAHWTAGRMLLDGMGPSLYRPSAQLEIQARLAGTQGHLAWFVSPPFVAGLYAPLAALPYAASALAWTALSAGTLIACIRRLGAFCAGLWESERRLVILAVVASYPVFELLAGGQDSALSLAVWISRPARFSPSVSSSHNWWCWSRSCSWSNDAGGHCCPSRRRRRSSPWVASLWSDGTASRGGSTRSAAPCTKTR
jgi:hypothetical protein